MKSTSNDVYFKTHELQINWNACLNNENLKDCSHIT